MSSSAARRQTRPDPHGKTAFAAWRASIAPRKKCGWRLSNGSPGLTRASFIVWTYAGAPVAQQWPTQWRRKFAIPHLVVRVPRLDELGRRTRSRPPAPAPSSGCRPLRPPRARRSRAAGAGGIRAAPRGGRPGELALHRPRPPRAVGVVAHDRSTRRSARPRPGPSTERTVRRTWSGGSPAVGTITATSGLVARAEPCRSLGAPSAASCSRATAASSRQSSRLAARNGMPSQRRLPVHVQAREQGNQ